jgi:hypothetical protein
MYVIVVIMANHELIRLKKIRLAVSMQIVQLVFLSTFNAPYMCPNIRCDGVKFLSGN